MDSRACILVGALLGGLGVLAGTFHAHGLEHYLAVHSGPELVTTRMSQFEVAVKYQMYHSLALIGVGLLTLSRPSRAARLAAAAFLCGVVLFCGFLYALVFTGITRFGMIVPIGGLAFLVGWIALAVAAVGVRQSPPADLV